jgi:uncharacterized protein (TIGR03118 family)
VNRIPGTRTLTRAFALASAVPLALLLAAPAYASPTRSDDGKAQKTTRFRVVNLISDQPGVAPLVDPNLVNSWGLALGPKTPLWVANNGTSTATMYADGSEGRAPTRGSLVVKIPTEEGPTGEAFNDTNGFVVRDDNGTGGPARFLFATESGDIVGWSPELTDTTTAVVATHVDTAVYKGLAIFKWHKKAFLLATDFHNNRVDVFDENFKRLTKLSGFFKDPNLPSDFAPFNVFVSGRSIFVSFAEQTPGSNDEMHGAGLGFVDKFTVGRKPVRIASRGPLNAPWGMAFAPDTFGTFAGALLVGNFGDGHINAYRDSRFIGQLRDNNGEPIVIDGLWALLPGTATTGGTGTLWFSSGPDDESHGLVGQILPVNKDAKKDVHGTDD